MIGLYSKAYLAQQSADRDGGIVMASVTPTYEEQRMSVGRVIQRAMRAITFNPVVVLGLALVIGAIPGVLLTYIAVRMSGAAGVQAASFSALMSTIFLSTIFGLLVSALVQGSLTRATIAANEGRKATFGESFAAALRVFLPLVGLSILFILGMWIGFILLIIPGIIFLVAASVAVPALVVERNGVFPAFRRSGELTKGARWKILGLFLLLGVAYLLLSYLVGLLGLGMYSVQNAGAELPISNLAGSVIVSTIVNMLWGTLQPSLYLELRQWKDGHDVDNLERVFA